MRRLLKRHGLTQGQQWQRVPRIDILSSPGQRRGATTTPLLRGLLVLVLLGELFWVQDVYRDRGAMEQSNERTKTQIQAAQQGLSREQQEVEALQTQISELQQQRDAREQVYREVTEGHVDWQAAISGLFGAQVPGVRYESVMAQPGGEVTLDGVATGLGAIANLQTHLGSISDIMGLQSLRWEMEEASLLFTAVFRVSP